MISTLAESYIILRYAHGEVNLTGWGVFFLIFLGAFVGRSGSK